MDEVSSLGQLIVHYAPGAVPILTKSEHAKASISLGRRWITLHDVADGDIESIASGLRSKPEVFFVEVNHRIMYCFTPNDPYYPGNGRYNSSRSGLVDQWGLSAIQSSSAWDITRSRDSQLPIAIVDTGVDGLHPDLKARMYRDENGKIIGYNSINNSTDAADDNGHGTHVAGIASAYTDNGIGVAGVSFATSRIMPVKALDAQGAGSDYSVAQAIVWAADHGARIINLSLGSPYYSHTMQLAVNYAWIKGCIIVAAAGNEGREMLNFPAACNSVIGIASTDRQGTLSTFSNSGIHVDCCAPGSDYLSTMPTYPVVLTQKYGFKQNYDALSGTSMATPVASGLVALIWATYKEASNEQLRKLLTQTTSLIKDETVGWNSRSGYGQLNAASAVRKERRLTGLGCITGQVVDSLGLPIQKARVSVGAKAVITASDGVFRIPNLPSGKQVNVVVTAPLPSGVKTVSMKVYIPDNADSDATLVLK